MNKINNIAGNQYDDMRIPLSAGGWRYRMVILLVAGVLGGTAGRGWSQDQAPAAPPTGAGATAPTAPAESSVSLANAKVSKHELKNELGVSADFMMADGKVTLPFGYSLANSASGFNGSPVSANRSTEYYGATVSYSYGRSWYLDLSYEHGVSSGAQSLTIQNTITTLNTDFNYTDDWYQLYIRYQLPQLLHNPRFKAYVRFGASMVQANLTARDTQFTPSLYSQNDDTTDILGNLGLGLKYSLYATPRFKLGLQGEAEAFYGFRNQTSTETFSLDFGQVPQSASINNDLYGFIGRATVHAELLTGHSGRFKLFTDFGVQYKTATISYPGGAKAPDEYLFGPYVKLGVSYVF